MNNKFFKLIFCLALLLSCTPSFGAKWKAKHVVFIGLDGWGAYSMEKANNRFWKYELCRKQGKKLICPL